MHTYHKGDYTTIPEGGMLQPDNLYRNEKPDHLGNPDHRWKI